jgi:hypothetical protein
MPVTLAKIPISTRFIERVITVAHRLAAPGVAAEGILFLSILFYVAPLLFGERYLREIGAVMFYITI